MVPNDAKAFEVLLLEFINSKSSFGKGGATRNIYSSSICWSKATPMDKYLFTTRIH